MLPAKELGVQERPIFLNQVRGPVEADLSEPALPGLSPGAVLAGIVEICNSGRGSVPHNFRDVGRMAITMHEPAPAKRVVARVLSRERWHNSLGHQVSTHVVGEAVPVVAAIGSRSVVKR